MYHGLPGPDPPGDPATVLFCVAGNGTSGVFFRSGYRGFFRPSQGSPDSPAETCDSQYDEDDEQDQAPDVLRDIDPDREFHAMRAVKDADRHCHDEKGDGTDNDYEDCDRDISQRIWFPGHFCPAVQGNPFGSKP
jgi:hypothetical protein